MSSENKETTLNGTPSIVDRDVSRNESTAGASAQYLPDTTGTHRQDLGVQANVDKAWDAQGEALEANGDVDLEKSHNVVEEEEDEEDNSTGSTYSAKDVVKTQRPRADLGRNASQGLIAAAPLDNTWVVPSATDVEKQAATIRSRTNSSATTIPGDLTTGGGGPSASRVSTDAYGNTYPEGGMQAYLCVFGSFCGLSAALGIMNTIGTYQAYLTTHQLQDLSDGTVGWIFGVYAFLSFFLGIQIGPIFDAYGPRLLIFAGSVFLTVAQVLLAECTKYWHFMLCFGVCGGIGTSLIFTPAIAAIGHHFLRKRGQFVGLAAAGSSFGGVIFPLALQSLFPQIGFAWSCRVVALCNLVLLAVANMFIRSRLPRKTTILLADIMPDFTIFSDLTFSFTTMAVFFTEWALFIPITYASSYALQYGVDEKLSYQLLAVLNAASSIGRYFPGLMADKIGRFNAIIITIALCAVLTLALWLPANGSQAIFIAYLVLFGIASGSGISLTPVCIGQLCATENLGKYYATCYTIASFATLTGIPIAGSIMGNASGGRGDWIGLILFMGCVYVAALLSFIAARVRGVGFSIKKIY